MTLEEAIELYLKTFDNWRKIAAAKGRVTRFANELARERPGHIVREKVLAILQAQNPSSINGRFRLEELRQRFTVNSLYLESDRVFGWYSTELCQAEALPMIRTQDRYEVSFYGHKKEIGLW